jgi:ribose 5-phosphate isomerase A
MAREAGIPLVELGAAGVDVAIDGADEIDPALEAIKGLGGAMTREKIVAAAARRFVLVADASKRVERLGERAPVPVEVLRFGWRRTPRRSRRWGASRGCAAARTRRR